MIQKREEEYAKEIDDVGLALVELVRDIKAKKSIAEIAGENLPLIMEAVNGVDQMDDEYAENRKVALATMGKRTGELTDVLLPLPQKDSPPSGTPPAA